MDIDERLDKFEAAIGELRGRLALLENHVTKLVFDRPGERPDRYAGLKTAITFAAIVIVPILVAILGGYFALKSAGLK